MSPEQWLIWFCTCPIGFGIAGGFGGFLMDTLHKQFIEIPQKVQVNGHTGYTLGCFGAVIAGTFAGVMADNSMVYSFLAGAGLGGIVTGTATVMRKKKDKCKDSGNGSG